MKKQIKKVISICSILAMVLSLAACGNSESNRESGGKDDENNSSGKAKTQYLTLAACPASSGNYAFFVGLGQAISKIYPEYNITVSESQGSVDISKRMRSGEALMGNGTSPNDYNDFYGEETFQGDPNEDLRLMLVYTINNYTLCVDKEAGIEDLSDLNGKKICPGATGTDAALLSNKLFDMFGVKAELSESNQSDATDAYSDRRLDGVVKTGVLGDSYVMQLDAARPISIVSMSKEEVEQFVDTVPQVKPAVIPAGTYSGIDYDVNTFAMYAGLRVSKELSQEDVYKMCKAAFSEGYSEIEAAFPGIKDIDMLQAAIDMSVLPLHAGTVQYAIENGYEVPEELIPEEYVPVQ